MSAIASLLELEGGVIQAKLITVMHLNVNQKLCQHSKPSTIILKSQKLRNFAEFYKTLHMSLTENAFMTISTDQEITL